MPEARRLCPTCGADYGGEALFCPRDGAPLTARKGGGKDPYVGALLDGKILLERLIGIGSMGRVYRGEQKDIERAVAVKVLHREHVKNATLVARFHREARVAGRLVHPNVIVVHGQGRLPTSDTDAADGEPYIVTEFLDGLTLRSALAASGGSLPTARTLHVVLQVADALGEAHAQGVVHRDLKPENVMLVRCGADPDFVKVLDFGVARVGEADSSVATHAGAILGTATYACPESARGDRVGPPGDVYSLATMLFECLSGKPPFFGSSPVDVLIQHAQTPAPDVRSMPNATSIPEAIARLVARNLAKNISDREPDARSFGRALAEAARKSGFDAEMLPFGRTLLGEERRATDKERENDTAPLAAATARSTLKTLTANRGRPS